MSILYRPFSPILFAVCLPVNLIFKGDDVLGQDIDIIPGTGFIDAGLKRSLAVGYGRRAFDPRSIILGPSINHGYNYRHSGSCWPLTGSSLAAPVEQVLSL